MCAGCVLRDVRNRKVDPFVGPTHEEITKAFEKGDILEKNIEKITKNAETIIKARFRI